jgi:hypothetical protein
MAGVAAPSVKANRTLDAVAPNAWRAAKRAKRGVAEARPEVEGMEFPWFERRSCIPVRDWDGEWYS